MFYFLIFLFFFPLIDLIKMIRSKHFSYSFPGTIKCNLLYLILPQLDGSDVDYFYKNLADRIVTTKDNNTFGFYNWILVARGINLYDEGPAFELFFKSCHSKTIYFILSWMYADVFPTANINTVDNVESTYNAIFLNIVENMTPYDEVYVAIDLCIFFTLFSRNHDVTSHCAYFLNFILNFLNLDYESLYLFWYYFINHHSFNLFTKSLKENTKPILSEEGYYQALSFINYIFIKTTNNKNMDINWFANQDERFNEMINISLNNKTFEELYDVLLNVNVLEADKLNPSLLKNLADFYIDKDKMELSHTFEFIFEEDDHNKSYLYCHTEVIYNGLPFLREEIENGTRSIQLKKLGVSKDVMDWILYYIYTGISDVLFVSNSNERFSEYNKVITQESLIDYFHFYNSSKKLKFKGKTLYWNMGYLAPLTNKAKDILLKNFEI